MDFLPENKKIIPWKISTWYPAFRSFLLITHKILNTCAFSGFQSHILKFEWLYCKLDCSLCTQYLQQFEIWINLSYFEQQMKEITHPIMKIEFYFHRNCYKEPVIASPEGAWQSPCHMVDRAPSEKRLLRRADALLAMTNCHVWTSEFLELMSWNL